MNIVVSNATTTTTTVNIHDGYPLYHQSMPIDVTDLAMGVDDVLGYKYTEQQETP